jgi:Cu-Zn family superoxide dismutase
MISKSLFIVTLATAFILSTLAAQVFAADTAPATTDQPASITADIIGHDGKKIGEVKASQVKDGVQFKVHVMGLTPGKHGIHIHAVGKCDTPDFKSAGGHFAKAGTHHGMQNPQGPHWGDLPNIHVVHGMGMATFTDKSVTLAAGDNSLNKAGGTSLVIHAGEDDEKTDPSGNSGDRVACAVLAK